MWLVAEQSGCMHGRTLLYFATSSEYKGIKRLHQYLISSFNHGPKNQFTRMSQTSQLNQLLARASYLIGISTKSNDRHFTSRTQNLSSREAYDHRNGPPLNRTIRVSNTASGPSGKRNATSSPSESKRVPKCFAYFS